MVKLNFQQLLLKSSVSQDPSEIIYYSDLVFKNIIVINENNFIIISAA